jgi:stage III sporulation protein AG
MQKKDGETVLTRLRTLVKKNPGLVYILYAVLGLIAVLFCLIGSEPHCGEKRRESGTTAEVNAVNSSGKDALELRLTDVLSKIRGAGKVDVLVTYETNGEIVTATVRQTDEDTRNANGSSGSEASRSVKEVVEPATVETDGGHAPIVLYTKEPTVRGVIVVAEGASDFSIRQKLQAAVHAATGIPIERIEVFEMSYEGS